MHAASTLTRFAVANLAGTGQDDTCQQVRAVGPIPIRARWTKTWPNVANGWVKKGNNNMQKNRIELAGHLGGKAIVRYLPSGTPVANVRMAEGYRYTDRNNQTQEQIGRAHV